MRLTKKSIAKFVTESNAIEGIKVPEDLALYDLHGKEPAKTPYVEQHLAAVQFVKENKKEKPTIGHVLQLHKILMEGIEHYAGRLRPFTVNIGGREAPSPFKLSLLLHRWIQLWGKGLGDEYSRYDLCYARHCEFEYIHPFADGNGRVGRLLFLWDCLYHKEKYLIIEAEHKEEYYAKIRTYVDIVRPRTLNEWK